jgi:c-di-GMP-binding flagellar brake protein YcgR
MKKLYLTISYGKYKKTRGYILDISKGGIGVASSEKIAKNTLVEIITIQKPFSCIKGRIVSVSNRQRENYRYRLGVKFVLMNKIKIQKIVRFILGIEKRERSRLILLDLS